MRGSFGSGGRFRPPRTGRIPRRYGGAVVRCPRSGEEIPVSRCERCGDYGVWHVGDLVRCRHEAEGLERRGHYAKTQEEWMEHLRVIDPETYRELKEEKENRERVLGEMEEERRDEEGIRARQGDVPGGGRDGCSDRDSGARRPAGEGERSGDDEEEEEEEEQEEEEEDEPEEEGW